MNVHIKYLNEARLQVQCDEGIAQELSEYFCFMVPNARFMPSFRNKLWDGRIRLFNTRNRTIYAGLKGQIERFCQDRQYEYTEDEEFASDSFSIHEAKEWIAKQNFPKEPRDYQIEAFVKCIRDRRRLFLSPTSSGKSLIIFMILKYLGLKAMVVVPTVALAKQMRSDFIEYCPEIEEDIHTVYAGQAKASDKLITITTWQSVYKLPKQYFSQFKVIVGDEAHLFKADSLTNIMDKAENTPYRLGFTGTLDGSYTNKMVLEGLFSTVEKIISSATLMERKQIADLKIKCIILEHPDQDRKDMRKKSYQEEIDFIVQNERRNKFIANLALSLPGNGLILFRYIEKQGDALSGLIKTRNTAGRPFYYISGKVDSDIREDLRKLINDHEDAIALASLGVFSTGINIPNLSWAIFASPSKSQIVVLQSIGRILRRSETKFDATWYDIADDLSWKNSKNYTLLHYGERIKIYNDEKFSYKQYRVKIQ
jgi:superfamily II DNA or RNA helicase